MYEFNQTEKEFLQRFGTTGNGKQLVALLMVIASKIDKASSIPVGADYGAQVEGRKLFSVMIEKITSAMLKKEITNNGTDVGVDEFD